MKFLSNYSLQIHKTQLYIKKKIKKEFPCPECSSNFSSKKSLNFHKNTIHKNNPKLYNCELCVYQTSRNYHLRRHLKQSHSSKECRKGKEDLGKSQIYKKAKNIIEHFLDASSEIKEVMGRNLLKDDVIKNITEKGIP